MISKRHSGYRSVLRAAIPGLLISLALASCSAIPIGHPSSAKLQPEPPSGNSQATATPADQSEWKLSWEDDFTGKGLPANWTADTGGYGFGTEQLQWNSDDSARLSGQGGLVITADTGGGDHTCWYGSCKYTSAKIQSTYAQAYGRFEARIKIPGDPGLWPAFWMVPATTTQGANRHEIDIIEVNNKHPYLVTGYIHDSSVFNYRAADVLSLPMSAQFHTYGVDWTPSGITWTLDGKAYGHAKSYANWPFDQPFVMILDLAVGGSWPGPPNANTAFPATMEVSWVRVYKWMGDAK